MSSGTTKQSLEGIVDDTIDAIQRLVEILMDAAPTTSEEDNLAQK
jgi:hypothetical protein